MDCEYCKPRKFGELEQPLIYQDKDERFGQVSLRMWLRGDVIRFYTWGFGSRRDYSIVINYCPICGRKLEKR